MTPLQVIFSLMTLGYIVGWIIGHRIQKGERYYNGFVTFMFGVFGWIIGSVIALFIVGIWTSNECVVDYVIEVGGCDRSGYCGVRGINHRSYLQRPVTGDTFSVCGPLQWRWTLEGGKE